MTLFEEGSLALLGLISVETSVLLLKTKPSGNRGGRNILIDTSVLIDGRILEVATAGFMPGTLMVPRSVLGELQLLADGSDHEKRSRARHGLEVMTQLQALPRVKVSVYPDATNAREGVDERLLELARSNGYELCTVDYNLQKVAEAQSIPILSLNALSQTLRMQHLPGERIELTILQKGQENGQGVGYLGDGTMVVVDNAGGLLGQTKEVEIIRSLQTSSGKMMFAKLTSSPDTGVPQKKFDKPQPKSSPRRFKPANRGNRKESAPSSRRRAPQSPEDDLLDLVNHQH